MASKRTCRVCGCTDDNCQGCILKTGHPCWWIAWDLCSACDPEPTKARIGTVKKLGIR